MGHVALNLASFTVILKMLFRFLIFVNKISNDTKASQLLNYPSQTSFFYNSGRACSKQNVALISGVSGGQKVSKSDLARLPNKTVKRIR
jgi:hypothetical protein